jgi:hypothetical protein
MAAVSHVDVARNNGRPELEMHDITTTNHEAIADIHRNIAQQLRKAPIGFSTPMGEFATLQAINAHYAAADAHGNAAAVHNTIAEGDSAEDASATRAAAMASASALDKSQKAQGKTEMARQTH